MGMNYADGVSSEHIGTRSLSSVRCLQGSNGTVKIDEDEVSISRDGSSRSPEDILNVVRRRISELRLIYNEEKPGLQGKVVLTFTIVPKGRVEGIYIESNTGFSEFDDEIKAAVSDWKFSEVNDGYGYDWVTIPIIFGE